MKAVGRRRWIVAGGNIPVWSTGIEPMFTSHDLLSVVNTSRRVARVELTIYYSNVEPAGEYRFDVQGCRVRRVRINDLIDPVAIQLGIPYGIVLESTVPVVVQFTRQDTRSGQCAGMMTTASTY
jgi:hypothetical protein